MKVDFYKHNLGPEEKNAVVDVFDGVFLTSGPKTKEFEEAFATYLGCNYCVGTSSWSMGSLITLKALGIGVGDEVITTPLTFIATANTIIQAGAKPVFVDVEPDTGNIDARNIEAAITNRTKAIMAVHLYGQMCDMIAIDAIANEHNLFVIEDSAHCVEGSRDGIQPGQLSTAAIFSFYATKNITSGEGGAIVTRDKDLYDKLMKYRLHGMSKSAADRYSGRYQHWDMELLGYKCNMNDIQAAMLLPQLKKIDQVLSKKQSICARYEAEFRNVVGLSYPKNLKNATNARHIFAIWVDSSFRDECLKRLQGYNIGVAVNFRSIHLLQFYREQYGFKEGDFPVAEKIGSSTITIPMYAKLTDQEIDYVIRSVVECVSV